MEQILDSKLLREDAIILVDNGKLMFTTITPKTHNSLVFARSFAVDTGNTANIDSTALGHWRKAGKLVDDFNRFVTADARIDQVILPIFDGIAEIRRAL